MPVTSTHPLYDLFFYKWQRARHVLAGEDDVKRMAELYLPKLSGQETDEYIAYACRASFFNASGRTQEGLLGLIFAHDPDLVVPPQIEEFLDDVTLTGMSFYGLSKHATNESIGLGRFGVYVDFSSEENRPYMVGYTAEQIINWRVARIAGKMQLCLVVLKENVRDPYSDGFTDRLVTQYRVLKLEPTTPDDATSPWVFRVYLYVPKVVPVTPGENTGLSPGSTPAVKETNESDYDVTTIEPKRIGASFNFIPFSFIGSTRNDPDPERPPLEDLFLVNLSHYRTSADLEHGRHYTALPTAWVAGFDEKTELRLGSGTAWISDNVQAKAGYLEFTGQGLGALEKAIESKEAQMAILGARMLEQQKKAVETAESQQIRQMGESSALGSVATTVGEAFTQALKFMQFWVTGKFEDDPEVISCEMNTKFVSNKMDALMVTALVGLWQARGITQKTLLWNLQTGELLPPDLDIEQEIEDIKNEVPPLTGQQMQLGDQTDAALQQSGDQFQQTHDLKLQSHDTNAALAAAKLKFIAKPGQKKIGGK